MPAVLTTITLARALDRFHCPVCGAALVASQEGFQEGACAHMSFFCDWVGEIGFPRTENAPTQEQAALTAVWDEHGSVDALAAACADTVTVFVFVESGRGGGHDGSEIAFGIDFSAAVDGN